jgi:23S rRNA pseudouridine2457 synthase
MAIGRLDEDSEGLLLLTTDGRLSEAIRSRHVEKEYYAQVDGLLTDEALAQLQQGVPISIHGQAYTTTPCQARRLDVAPELPARARRIRDDRHGPTSWVRVGGLWLNGLAPGAVRELPDLAAAIE